MYSKSTKVCKPVSVLRNLGSLGSLGGLEEVEILMGTKFYRNMNKFQGLGISHTNGLSS
jgi:hypothetical protein